MLASPEQNRHRAFWMVFALRAGLSLSALTPLATASCESPHDPRHDQTVGDSSGAETATSVQPLLASDGSVTVSTANRVLNSYGTLAPLSDAKVGDRQITVSDITTLAHADFGPLATGDLLLIIQMQGATIDMAVDSANYGTVTSLGGAGNYEFVQVGSVTNNVIAIDPGCGGLKNSYTTAGKTQIVRVPQLSSLAVTPTGSVTARAWNGSVGGIVALQVHGETSLDGAIDASALGFRGGSVDNESASSETDVTLYRSLLAADGGEKGEGIAGFGIDYLTGRYGRGAPANGGGGGNSHNTGGGGGANETNGLVWTGQGVMSASSQSIWLLEGIVTPANSSGGGRGGYSFSYSNQDARVFGPGRSQWNGNARRERGGLGGHGLNNDPKTRLFMGGGGGAGDGNNGEAGGGGRGGGMVFLLTGTLQGEGRIFANGQAGSNTAGGENIDAAGGGGGGGTIILHSRSGSVPSTLSVRADGGAGGNQLPIELEAEGPGGGGGGGFIAIGPEGSTLSRSARGGTNGTTASTALIEFPANGATSGAAGIANATLRGADIPYCVNQQMIALKVTDGLTSVVTGNPTTYTVTVENNGITDLSNAVLNIALPESATGTSWLNAVTFTCSNEDTLARCASAAGSGAIVNSSVTLPSGGKLTYVFTGTVDAPGDSVLTTTARLNFDPSLSQSVTDQTTVIGRNSAPVIVSPVAQTTDEDVPLVFANSSTLQVSDAEVTGQDSIDVDLAVLHGTLTLASTAGITFRNTADGTNDAEMRLSGTLSDITAALSSLTYQPSQNYYGPDSLTVTANDRGLRGFGGEQQTIARVNLTVSPINDAPVASDDVAAAPGGQSATIDVLANDTDVDGDTLRVLSATGPVGSTGQPAGTVVVVSNSRVEYFPPTPGISDTVTFEYTVTDGKDGGTATGKVTVAVGSGDGDDDGLSDADEVTIGTNPSDADSDDDGVIDGSEPSGSLDSDGDGLINALDPDSDNDGLFDGTELGYDCSNRATDLRRNRCIADADKGLTKTSPLDRDTDDGSVSDGAEDKNHDGALQSNETDPTAGHGADDTSIADRDSDGLGDDEEKTIGSNPDDADSDDDGVIDGQEINPTDDTDRDGLINVLDADSDNDGLFDGTELGRDCAHPATDKARKHCTPDADPTTVTSPVLADTDGGGKSDGAEDTNLDGKQNAGEIDPTLGHGSDDKTLLDSDGDGLTDAVETHLGSNPNDVDTDDDGLNDGAEANPSEDTDGDGLINVLDADSDGDGLFDGTETGKGCGAGTDLTRGNCIADSDPTTTTSMLLPDTDQGGMMDGAEDTNKNGAIDTGERNPLDPADDGCGKDSQCGDIMSGRVCNVSTGECIDGCRGKGGNGCKATQLCGSTSEAIGTCSDVTAAGGASGTTTNSSPGTSIAGATGTLGGAPASETTTAKGASTGGNPSAQGGETHAYSFVPNSKPVVSSADVVIEGGGCSCSTSARSRGQGMHAVLLALGAVILGRVRRDGSKRTA